MIQIHTNNGQTILHSILQADMIGITRAFAGSYPIFLTLDGLLLPLLAVNFAFGEEAYCDASLDLVPYSSNPTN